MKSVKNFRKQQIHISTKNYQLLYIKSIDLLSLVYWHGY